MLRKLKSLIGLRKKYKDIDPDEIFLDSKNLPDFDVDQFEGRIEKPINKKSILMLSLFFILITILFGYKTANLQITNGRTYKIKSENNRLDSQILFANRGVILDRKGSPLTWNTTNDTDPNFSLRVYATSTGLSTLLGYIKYPSKDSTGVYWEKNYVPKDGLEKIYDYILSGKNGIRLREVDAHNKIISESVVLKPVDGENLQITIDKGIQKKLYESMTKYSEIAGYKGGAGAIMDINTGEIIAMASFPEYDSNILSSGDDKEKIQSYLLDKNNPFLNRVVSGLYTPGSIVKPFVAIGALTEGIIDPKKQILSTGQLVVPNPYFPDKPSVFKDWKAHGYVDMVHALAVSSNVYFFQIGGGFEGQEGLGIENIEKYLRLFGFGDKTEIELSIEQTGIIPNPLWKKNIFGGEIWRLGDTYNTSIGQYGLQVTPIQALRAIASIANEERLLSPTLIHSSSTKIIYKPINIDKDYLKIVKEGMRLAVTEGTAQALNFPYVKISAKTGTAELGVSKSTVNSWVVGFFPSEKPKYAFTLVMEKGQSRNQIGAALVLKDVFEWINLYEPEYFK